MSVNLFQICFRISVSECSDINKKKTKKSTDRNKGVVKKLVNEIINLYLISNLLK